MSPARLPASIPLTGPLSARCRPPTTSTRSMAVVPPTTKRRQRRLQRQRQRNRDQDADHPHRPSSPDAPSAGLARRTSAASAPPAPLRATRNPPPADDDGAELAGAPLNRFDRDRSRIPSGRCRRCPEVTTTSPTLTSAVPGHVVHPQRASPCRRPRPGPASARSSHRPRRCDR